MYLGIDLGTSGVKLLIIDEQQKIVASSHSPLNISRPKPGWSEQDPNDWILATQSAIKIIRKEHPKLLPAVRGIGLTGQMHGATLLGEDTQVLRPCILWNDTRSHREADELDALPDFQRVSGNIVFPGFTAPKLLWVKNNEPDIFSKISHVLLPKDYLRLWLSGEFVSEPSDASGTSWFDVGTRQWSSRLVGQSGIDENWLPRIVEGNAVSGKLRGKLADEWGIRHPVVIAGGAGDNAASAIGMGIVSAGSAFVSIGTSGVLFAANDQYLPNAESAVHAFCHALPDKWHQMGVILSATDALNWYAGIVGEKPESLVDELGDQLQPPSQVKFLPYLSGERTPHNDANIRGGFLGLMPSSERVTLTQSVIEGVGFAFRDNLNALQQAGTTLERLIAVGGGSNSVYWLKTIATILNLPIDMPVKGDFGASFGAARLGLMAAEQADPYSICTIPRISKTIEPDKNLISQFDVAYQKFALLYPALKSVEI